MKVILIILICLFVCRASAQERSIAFTFDDLPISGRAESLETATEVTNRLLTKLKASNIVAAGFVNEQKLYFPGEIDRRVTLLERWLDAGHELGNHTFSHIAINSASLEEYKDDLIRGETVTSLLLEKRGRKLSYFRHTQLRTGPTDEYRMRLSEFLKARKYRVAPVTIDSNEYLFAARYSEAAKEGSEVKKDLIVNAYIAYMEAVTSHFENLSKDFLGYEVPQVLLLHANQLNADHFDKLEKMYRNRGYRFISLDQALKDKAYTLPEVTSRRGLSWLHRWMLAKGLEMKEEPAEPRWIGSPIPDGFRIKPGVYQDSPTLK